MDKSEGIVKITIKDVIPPPVSPPLYRQINADGTDVIPPKAQEEFIQIEISDNCSYLEKSLTSTLYIGHQAEEN